MLYHFACSDDADYDATPLIIGHRRQWNALIFSPEPAEITDIGLLPVRFIKSLIITRFRT